MVDFDKKSCSREELIEWRLNRMIKMVDDLPPQEKLSSLANDNKYIRVCGEQYRGVSLSEKSPLCGYGNRASRIKTILHNFEDEKKNHEMEAQTLENKEERQLQSWLIKEALKNHRKIGTLLGIHKYFDELWFCLDEVSLGDRSHPVEENPTVSTKRSNIVRCDVLSIGLKDGCYSPVLIELKSTRNLKRLIDQLNNFIKDIESTPKIHKSILSLMKKCAGIPENSPFKNEFQKIILWPRLEQPPKSTTDKIGKAIIEVGYTFEKGRWSFHAQ